MIQLSRPTTVLLLLGLLVLFVTACQGGLHEDAQHAAGETEETESHSEGANGKALARVPSNVDTSKALRAGFLIVDGVYNSELIAPYDIFHHTPFHTAPSPGIEVFTVSPNGAPVTTFEGLVINAHYSFATAPEIDILVVPSAEHSMTTDLENGAMMQWVAEVGTQADFVLSLCDGAFVLAEAGLLTDRAVTTFPSDQDRFHEMFPTVDLRRNTGFVHDGQAITSEGGAKSYDPALYLVDHLYGEKVATGVAGGLVITWPPVSSDATIIAK